MNRLIVLSLMVLISLSSLHAQKMYVVSVGVSDYVGTESDLCLTVNDAKVFKWIYDKNKKSETVLLKNSQATKKNVLYFLKATFSKAKVNDIVIFYFSGHGYPGGFVCYNDEMISYTDIKNIFAKCKSKNKMIFADACFSGQFREPDNCVSPSVTPTNMNVMLFLSSRSDEYSIERSDMKNGFFTTYLQKGLRGNADVNRDRTITAIELYNFVSKGVIDISYGAQHPVMWGKFNHSMPVMIW